METNKKSRWTILLVVVLSTFMSTLDGSIVNVALPSMGKALGVTTSDIQLVATCYLVTITGVILIFGKLGDMYGKAKLFSFGLALFTMGSLLCGLTHSFPLLIIARIIQGIGAAGTMANSQGIIAETFPPSERGKALGITGTAVALGSLVGPGLGGIIVGVTSWEYIFLINVPIGILVFIAARNVLPRGEEIKGGKLDWQGAGLFMLTIIPLFAALDQGLQMGFTHPVILGGFFIAICSFLAFLNLEKKKINPLISLDIFHNKIFSLSIFCGFLSFIAIFCSNIILPFYLQDVRSYTPQYSGFIMMVYPLVLMIVSPLSGYLADKIGSEVLTFLGLTGASIGLFCMATLKESTSWVYIVIIIAIMSMGMGLFQSPNNVLVMSTVSRDKLGVAGSINALVRNLGMAGGIALATTLLYSRMSQKIGFRVTDYVEGRNDIFLYGMRTIYITAGCICMLGVILTFIRFRKEVKFRNMD